MSVVVIPYGRRAYGRVHEHGGEYAVTQFAHVCFLPLVPLASFWVTNEPGSAAGAGIPIKLHWASVRAAYARVWLPLLGCFFLIAPPLFATILGLALIGLGAWSWRGRSRHGVRAGQRSDFDRVALGHRCDPAWMTQDMRDHLSRKLNAQLAASPDARPPEDVARFGARDLDEAVLAYGILRLASARRSRAAAERLRASVFDPAPAHGEPYREAPSPPAAGFAATITATAQAAAARSEARQRETARSRWFHDARAQAMILVATTCAAIAVLYDRAPATVVDGAALASRPPVDDRVIVHCDRIADLGWTVHGGGSTKRVVFCVIGDHALPVVRDDEPTSPGDLLGKLKHLPAPAHAPWVPALHKATEIDSHCYHDLYLDHESETDTHVAWVAAVACSLATLIGWPLWLIALLRRRRPAAA